MFMKKKKKNLWGPDVAITVVDTGGLEIFSNWSKENHWGIMGEPTLVSIFKSLLRTHALK